MFLSGSNGFLSRDNFDTLLIIRTAKFLDIAINRGRFFLISSLKHCNKFV